MVTDLEGGVVLGGLCDKNCFCCPFEDCISDEMDYEDYIEEKRIDKIIGIDCSSVSAEQKAVEQHKNSDGPEQKANYRRRYYEENRERALAYQKKYYAANKESILRQKKEKYGENRQKNIERQRRYREANRDAIAAYGKRYYQKNRNKIAEYRKRYREANREKLSAYGKKYYKEKIRHEKDIVEPDD